MPITRLSLRRPRHDALMLTVGKGHSLNRNILGKMNHSKTSVHCQTVDRPRFRALQTAASSFSAANQMSGLQATHRTSGARQNRQCLQCCTPATMAEHTFNIFAHTNREHASTSTQTVAKLQRLTHPPCSSLGRAVAAGPIFCDNLRRGCEHTKIRMATW